LAYITNKTTASQNTAKKEKKNYINIKNEKEEGRRENGKEERQKERESFSQRTHYSRLEVGPLHEECDSIFC
jgi:hypothetical protein